MTELRDIDELDRLATFDIVFLCDDSSSMGKTLKFKSTSRWNELQKNVKDLLAIIRTVQRTGVDICFFNRPGAVAVTDWKQVKNLFTKHPLGPKPLTNTLWQIMEERYDSPRATLIIIGIDGHPDDGEGYDTDY